MRLRLLACSVLSALVLTSCGGGDSSSVGSTGEPGAPVSSGGSEPGTTDAPAEYKGLCGWVAPEDMAAVFGGPVDASGFEECRVAAQGDFEASGLYHLRLEQSTDFDSLIEDLEAAAAEGGDHGFELCDRETVEVGGFRVFRAVQCPTAGSRANFSPIVYLELGEGRLLESMPQSHTDQASAEAASAKFVEIFEAYAQGMQGLPLINELWPGEWVEIYNPSDTALDLSGYRITVADTLKPEEIDSPPSLDVPAGTTVPAGGHVVIDISTLPATGGGVPLMALVDGEGRPADLVRPNGYMASGKVLRRNGDGGPICSSSPSITKGQANPPRTARCDG